MGPRLRLLRRFDEGAPSGMLADQHVVHYRLAINRHGGVGPLRHLLRGGAPVDGDELRCLHEIDHSRGVPGQCSYALRVVHRAVPFHRTLAAADAAVEVTDHHHCAPCRHGVDVGAQQRQAGIPCLRRETGGEVQDCDIQRLAPDGEAHAQYILLLTWAPVRGPYLCGLYPRGTLGRRARLCPLL